MAGEQIDLPIVTTLTGQAAFGQAADGIRQVQGATQGLNETQRMMRKETEAAAAAIRGQRMATTQLGMQISQVGTQMASGTSVGQIFAQQIGDIGYALTGMSGRLGAVGAFLSGPWGVGLSLAAMALIPLITNLAGAKEAAVDLAKTSEETQSAIQNYYKAIGYTEPVENAIAASRRLIVAMIQERQEALKTAEAHMMRMKVILQSNMSVVRGEDNIFRKLFGDNPAEKAAAANAQVEGLVVQINKLKNALGKPVKVPELPKVNTGVGGSTSRATSSIGKITKDVKTLDEMIDQSTIDALKFAAQMEKMGDAAGEAINKTLLDSMPDNIQAVLDSGKAGIEALYAPINRAKEMSDAMGKSFSDGIKGMITGASSFKDMMSSVIDSVINKLWEMFVVQQIVGLIGKGISAITGIPMTGKAIGGSVQSGQPYMVGERGPEMFVPSRSGSIVPNGKMGGGISISVDARGSADPAAVRQQVELGIAQAAPYIIAAAQNRTLRTAGRPRLPGTIG